MYITNLNKTYQIPSQQYRKKLFSCQQRNLTQQDNDKYSADFKKLMTKIFSRIYPKGHNQKIKQQQQSRIHERRQKQKFNTNYKQKSFFTQAGTYEEKHEYQNMRIQGRKKCQTQSNLHPQRKLFKITCKTPTISLMRHKQHKKIIQNQKFKSFSNEKVSPQAQSLQKTFTRTRYSNLSSKNCNKLIVGQSYKKQINLPIANSYADEQGYIKMVTLFKDRQKGTKYNDKKMNFTKQNWAKKIVQKQKTNRNKMRAAQFNNNKINLADQFQPWKIQHNQLITQDQYFNLKKNF